ncbi:MarR family winged helix-turn-helix transcriptional regulator [Burkholderia ambifaria]|uniref:MarR family transcriptional regulator n=1 Tax=Burkholderia ambifaria TaxID=152480 RepID=A0AA41E8W6_9BURK|nr:MarR family transcriptional regulator [Burkholderia ambifaria]MBR8130535.1 MarR family transcriptional regulator [Burkholderia ambifaria]PRE02998.1 MarR family transcriptional regulator [Burkholderia ambifaria]UEP46962.1 MarR family transcriptional regulator [Burkholderia ambifaria]
MKGRQAGLDQFLTYRLHALAKRSDRGIADVYRHKLDISLPEARVIAAVGAFGPFSIMDLARHTNLDKSQASRAAEALLRQGLLERSASEDDGRIVLIALTTDGRALHRRIMPIVRKWNEGLLACLSDSERQTFERLLDKVVAHAVERDE